VLLGPSGSGKTTTLRIVAGLETADAGEVLVGGAPIGDLPPERRNVGMVFQSHALFPHKRVADNIGYGLLARGRPRDEVARRVGDVAERLRISALLGRLPRELSGGERQRVALARALVREPDVLLLDEPLSSLDAQLRIELRAEIARLQAATRTTTVYVTHDQADALALGHRVAVLNGGRLEQVGPPQAVYDRPATLFVAGFLGTPPMNLLRREREVVGVRPEHVYVGGSRWAPPEPAAGGLEAVVERVEPAGDHTLLRLDAGGDTLMARVEPGFAATPGERRRAWFAEGAQQRFDAVTGRAAP
jgi:ABC-type sugar transport system ATPase subunit